MLLCFLAYVIATLTSYTVQFMNCLHCLLDKTMWNQQFGWLATTPKFKGILTIGCRKRWSSNYMTPLCDNYQTAHFEISSNCLFCGNSDKNYGEKAGYQLILVRIFNFQSMPSMSWRHAIKGMTNMVQLYPYKNGIYSRHACQGLCLPYLQQQKNRASIRAWCWHENKKSESWPQSWYTESRRLIRWCLYLEANGEEQTTVNDLIINMKNSVWLVMMIMTHRG